MLAAGILVAAVVWAAPGFGATREDFDMRTAADIVDLCGASPQDDHYSQAVNFCHGYLVGAYDYYEAVSGGKKGPKYVCAPEPPPTRNQIVSGLVAWLRDHPEYSGENPVNATFKYLAEKYPCGK